MSEQELNNATQSSADLTNERLNDLLICPCCGKRTLIKPTKIKEEITDQYLACIISGTPFAREYSLFNGKLVLKVQQINPETAKTIRDIRKFTDVLAEHTWKGGVPLEITTAKNTGSIFSLVDTVEVSGGDGQPKRVFAPAEHCSIISEKMTTLLSDMPTKKSDLAGWDNEALKLCVSLCNKEIISGVPIDIVASTVETHTRVVDVLAACAYDDSFFKSVELV